MIHLWGISVIKKGWFVLVCVLAGYISFMSWMYLFKEDTGTKEVIIGKLDSVKNTCLVILLPSVGWGIIYVCLWRQDSWPVELVFHSVLSGICHQIMGHEAMMRVKIDAPLLSIWIICTRVGGSRGVIQEILIELPLSLACMMKNILATLTSTNIFWLFSFE